jgi:hypothetical protein
MAKKKKKTNRLHAKRILKKKRMIKVKKKKQK